MPEQSNGAPQKKSNTKEQETPLKESEKLGTRAMLLRVMALIGDERIGDDQLRRALMILEGIEPDESPGV